MPLKAHQSSPDFAPLNPGYGYFVDINQHPVFDRAPKPGALDLARLERRVAEV
jgi:hypothetical protein